MTAPTVKPRQSAGEGGKNVVATVPFTRASRKKSKLAFNIGPITLTAGSQTTNPIQLPPGGFVRYIDIQIVGTTAGNAAAVAFKADAPWSVLNYVDLRNSAGDSLIVPFTGYQLYLINKYGALSADPPFSDPRAANNGYSVTTGAGATGGSFSFFLRIPLEYDPRDAMCAVPNLAANKSYQLQLGLGTISDVYSTAPTSAPAITATGVMYYWSQPNASTPNGTAQEVAPLSNGSIAMWRLQPTVVSQGDKLTQLLNVGNVIRTAIFVLRDSAGARTAAGWPAVTSVVLNDDILDYMPTAFWQRQMSMDYGLTTGAVEAAGGLDNAVFVLSQLNNQRGVVQADGPRDQYLVTFNTTLLQLRSTSFGATANTLEIITNEIKPTSALALYSPNLT